MRCVPVLVLALILAPLPARSTPTDFSFKDVELSNIFQTIAVLGRFNVIIDPQVSRAKMTVLLKQLEPLDALYAIATIQELRVKRLESQIELGGPMTETYAIGRVEKIANSFESGSTRTVLLRYTSPAEVCRVLAPNTEAPHSRVRVSPDERSNRIVMFGPTDAMEPLEKLIGELDRPASQMKVQMFLVAGLAGKPEPVWQGTAMLVNGQPTRFEVTGGGKPTSTGWRVAKLSGQAMARVNPEGFSSVTVALDVTADDRGVTGQFKLHAQQQLNAGQETDAGSLEVSPGQVLTLRVLTTPLTVTPPPPPPPPQPDPRDLEGTTVPTPPADVIDLGPASTPPSPHPQGIDGLDLEGI